MNNRNQAGLEALASLCGGAMKARLQKENTQTQQATNPDEPPPTENMMRSNVVNIQNSAINKRQISQQQQLYQAVLSATNGNGSINQFPLPSGNNYHHPVQSTDSNNTGAAQQLAYFNHIYNTQKAIQLSTANQHQQNPQAYENNRNGLEQQIAAVLAMATGNGAAIPQVRVHAGDTMTTMPSMEKQQTVKTNTSISSIQKNIHKQQQLNNTPRIGNPTVVHRNLNTISNQVQQDVVPGNPLSNGITLEDKMKQDKRAANRRSAQLSRKRKKLFIEELREENQALRHKEQILRSIPDLVVVFDSAGRLAFVSESVGRFLDFTSESLEGTSFWNRLCDMSVRLLKAAFMDAMAAKKTGSSTTPLGDGLWELRLVDKDGKQTPVVLNGVVYFNGESPECVCSIRPINHAALQYVKSSTGETTPSPITPSTGYITTRDNIQAQQSVSNTSATNDKSEARGASKVTNLKSKPSTKANSVSEEDSVMSGMASDSS